MAAGLPVVASDWDGYRETVRDGVDGFLIPTWMAESGSAQDLAALHAQGAINYDQYIGQQSQYTAVDTESFAVAITALIQNPELRTRMGHAARRRAQGTYDWKNIIRAYENLFEQLLQVRTVNQSERSVECPVPLRQDPTILFQSYATHQLSDATIIRLRNSESVCDTNEIRRLSMNDFAISQLDRADEIVHEAISSLGNADFLTLGKLSAKLEYLQGSPVDVNRCVLWLAKMGVLEFQDTALPELFTLTEHQMSACEVNL